MVLARFTNPRRAAAALLATLPFALVAHPVAAQVPVVQAVPPPAQGDLSRALQRLARSPADFDALVAAGKASLALDDIDAAIGFFGRADVVRPGDPQVKAGLAGANVRSGRPIEALELYDQAIAAGALPATIAADRGLAYDLVGDNVSAQTQYRLALANGANDETARRLGLSQAISGDARAFEATLLPMLQKRDFAAYRARAFGLAILGKQQDAVAIAEAVMPRDLSSRMAPYLQYMPRLTRAQQAAAANLGNFPRAAQVGRDDPRFAQYAGPQNAAPAAPAGAGDSRLAPSGEPLGSRQASSRSSQRQSAAERRRAAQVAAEQDKATRAAAARQEAAVVAARAPARSDIPFRERIRRLPPPSPPPPPPASRTTPPPPPPPPPATVIRQAPPLTAPTPLPSAAAAASRVELPPVSPGPQRAVPQPVVVATLPPSNAVPGSGLAQLPSSQPQAVTQAPVVVVPVPAKEPPVAVVLSPPAPPPPAEDVSVADAFADLADASGALGPAAGAVDITAIKPRIELPPPPPPSKAPPPPPPPPPKPKEPSRVWVQVATGRDVKALGFDWRKFAKQEPALLGKRSPYTAQWGQTRRLVTGPLDSAKAANKLVSDLKNAGIDAFVFTSDEGEAVSPLK